MYVYGVNDFYKKNPSNILNITFISCLKMGPPKREEAYKTHFINKNRNLLFWLLGVPNGVRKCYFFFLEG